MVCLDILASDLTDYSTISEFEEFVEKIKILFFKINRHLCGYLLIQIILIYREDNKEVSQELRSLFSVLQKNKVSIYIHPLSFSDIQNDKDVSRKQITLSKIGTYPCLENPPNPESDTSFRTIILRKNNRNEIIDDAMLFCLYKNAVSFLITNDLGIHANANRLNISDRVLNIEEALIYFSKQYATKEIKSSSPALEVLPLHNLNLNDNFFDSLRSDYPTFNNWFQLKAQTGNTAWIYKKIGTESLSAFLMLKIEFEVIESIPLLEKQKRVKICTFKVEETGLKIGEMFIKISIEYAIKHDCSEIYLTHFITEEDRLLILIEHFGFRKVALKKDGEAIFIKRLRPIGISNRNEIQELYYPSFCDSSYIRKFIVPIQPKYHCRLFQDYEPEHLLFSEYMMITEGNTIQKVYLCHAISTKMRKGDILLFYLSKTSKILTACGVIDEVQYSLDNTDSIINIIGKRSVYTRAEIECMAKKKVTLIVFKWHFYLKKLDYKFLCHHNILKGPPQSILEISHENYEIIKKNNIESFRFALNQT